jgi:DNA processing protein
VSAREHERAVDVDRVALAALSSLPGIGPSRLRALLSERTPSTAWHDLAAGGVRPDASLAAANGGHDPSTLLERWAGAARRIDLGEVADHHRRAEVRILCPGDADWPDALEADPDPPLVLFALGDPSIIGAAPAVAIVGTRTATHYGTDVARHFGHALASAGVSIVSGLAAGIDGAAHRGALDAGGVPPVGVVGSGLDVVYPRGHRQLWQQVAAAGVLVSEWPLGTRPGRWRFPARNRIIAALSNAVVVVESASTGGALHTVEEAVRRDRPVLAVPGPITSRASQGTNRLLADGATPACDPDDVLVAVGLGGAGATSRAAAEPAPGGDAAVVLRSLGWQPATLDQLVLRTGLAFEVVVRAAAELEQAGWVATDGGWFERRR